MMHILISLAATAMLVANPSQSETPAERAKRNYEALIRGEKQVQDLSPRERAELLKLEQLAKSRRPDTRSATERCRADEIDRVGGSPSELELRIIGLKCSQR